MKKSLLLIVAVLLLTATACKQGNTEPEYSGCGAVNTPDHEKYELKSGDEIRTILINLAVQPSNVTAFKPSQTPPASTIPKDKIKYLDYNNNDVICWFDANDSTIYYYANNITTADASRKLFLPQNSSYTFSNFEYLTQIDLSAFDSGNVTNMSYMFYNCQGLTSLDLSNFNTSNVSNMSYMFAECRNLQTLNLTTFNTSNVTTMEWMFCHCHNLEALDISSFDTSKVTNMRCAFACLYALDSLDFTTYPNFTTENVTNMVAIFEYDENITSLDISNFDTSNVIDMKEFFYGCRKLENIYVSDSFVTTNVTNSYRMFYDCYKLVGGNGTTFNSSIIDQTYARIDGGPDSSTPGYFTLKTTP